MSYEDTHKLIDEVEDFRRRLPDGNRDKELLDRVMGALADYNILLDELYQQGIENDLNEP